MSQDEKKPPQGGDQEIATITVTVLANGHARLSAVYAGHLDSSYAPVADWRAAREVGKLLGEFRSRQVLSLYQGEPDTAR